MLRASTVARLLFLPYDAAAQGLTLEIENGRVTLSAQGVSVRQILDRWAKAGDVTVVNAERVSATPLTLTLVGVPEREALATLLRDVSGYVVGSRRQTAAGAVAGIDRILILTSTPGAAPAGVAAPRLPVSRPGDAVKRDAEPDATTAPVFANEVDDTPSVDQQPRPPRRAGPVIAPAVGEAPPAASPRFATNPFGVTAGSAQPGTIAPVPQAEGVGGAVAFRSWTHRREAEDAVGRVSAQPAQPLLLVARDAVTPVAHQSQVRARARVRARADPLERNRRSRRIPTRRLAATHEGDRLDDSAELRARRHGQIGE